MGSAPTPLVNISVATVGSGASEYRRATYSSFDHLIRDREELVRTVGRSPLAVFEIDREFERRRPTGKSAGLAPVEDFIDKGAGAPETHHRRRAYPSQT